MNLEESITLTNKKITFLSDPFFAEYADLMCTESIAFITNEIIKVITSSLDWQVIDLQTIPETSETLPYLIKALSKHTPYSETILLSYNPYITTSANYTDYYQSRIDRIWEVFNYKQEKYTPSKEKLNLDGVSVVVYLHSFTDAQYVWGYDGYHDLMDWCLNTISLPLEMAVRRIFTTSANIIKCTTTLWRFGTPDTQASCIISNTLI